MYEKEKAKYYGRENVEVCDQYILVILGNGLRAQQAGIFMN